MSGNNENIVNHDLPRNDQSSKQVLFVAPLNSVPYVDLSSSRASSSKVKKNVETPKPALIFLPDQASQETKDLAAQMKTGVLLTGSAATGLIGPAVGRVDVFDSDDHFYFRVSLPGVEKNTCKCDVEENGIISIEGATLTGEATLWRHSQVFKMQTQNLCPPGPFTISFKLPGPIHKEGFTSSLEFGVLEGKVKKMRDNSGHVQL